MPFTYQTYSGFMPGFTDLAVKVIMVSSHRDDLGVVILTATVFAGVIVMVRLSVAAVGMAQLKLLVRVQVTKSPAWGV